MTGNAIRTAATVGPDGRLHVDVPLPPGTPVEVIVFVPTPDDFSDLVAAAGSATGFWDNPLDDEDWTGTDDPAFAAGLARRLESIASGTADLVPWEQAREEMRAELARRIATRQKPV
jgi:hypothetical protein